MNPVKWCPHCQSPNSADELQCLKCAYAFRVRLTVEPDEPLTTFTPYSAPVKARRFHWQRLATIGGVFAGLIALCFVGGIALYYRTPQDTPRFTPVSNPRYAPRFSDTDRRMLIELDAVPSRNQGEMAYTPPQGENTDILLTPAPMTNWLGVHQGQSQSEVFTLCGLPNGKGFVGSNAVWVYVNADNSLNVLFENGSVSDVQVKINN